MPWPVRARGWPWTRIVVQGHPRCGHPTMSPRAGAQCPGFSDTCDMTRAFHRKYPNASVASAPVTSKLHEQSRLPRAKRARSVDDCGGFDLDQVLGYVQRRNAQQGRRGCRGHAQLRDRLGDPFHEQGILSGVQSTTYTVSFATSSREAPTSAKWSSCACEFGAFDAPALLQQQLEPRLQGGLHPQRGIGVGVVGHRRNSSTCGSVA